MLGSFDAENAPESGKIIKLLSDIDWQKRNTEDGQGGSADAGHGWRRRSVITSHDRESDMERANADFEWGKRQISDSDDPEKPLKERVVEADDVSRSRPAKARGVCASCFPAGEFRHLSFLGT